MILVVEDDVHLRHFVEFVLRDRDCHRLVSYGSGQDAIDALVTLWPDVVLSDLRLPDQPGEEVARAAGALRPRPRIVLFSADTPRLERARPLADAILAKPFALHELRRVIAGSP